MDFWRQADIVSQDDLNRHHYTLIGAGGIGSVVGLVLAKMGVRAITAYDPDTVEPHNLPNQMFRLEDVGRPKVQALAEICQSFARTTITARHQPFTSDRRISGIVIMAVDTMHARRTIWEDSIRHNPSILGYVEARMGAQEGRVYTVTPHDPDDVVLYEKTLYTDEAAVDLPCTARATGYNAFYLAGLLVSQIQKLVMRQRAEKEIIFDLVSNLVLVTK